MKLRGHPNTKLKFLEPMYARLVNELPEGKEWLYEVKFDGYRCLAGGFDGSNRPDWQSPGPLFEIS
jgi:ATP-dependent DNA ligase